MTAPGPPSFQMLRSVAGRAPMPLPVSSSCVRTTSSGVVRKAAAMAATANSKASVPTPLSTSPASWSATKNAVRRATFGTSAMAITGHARRISSHIDSCSPAEVFSSCCASARAPGCASASSACSLASATRSDSSSSSTAACARVFIICPGVFTAQYTASPQVAAKLVARTSRSRGHGSHSCTPPMMLVRTRSFTAQKTDSTGTVRSTGRKPSNRRSNVGYLLTASFGNACSLVLTVSSGCSSAAFASSMTPPATSPPSSTSKLDVLLRNKRKLPT
mmetsp:Transcript_1788/g.5359  ORF Transcript_1788/g.5359 Transcript_1788/m.5359 type:complete len:276 (-) Transcript_1788:144-971(-)